MSDSTPAPSPSPAPAPARSPSTEHVGAVPLRELLDAALHVDEGQQKPTDDDGAAVEVPLSRAERRNNKRGGSPTPDRSYPSQTANGRNGFARNPRRSPTRRQG